MKHPQEELNQGRRRVLGVGAAGVAAALSTRGVWAQPEGGVPTTTAPKEKLIERDVTFASGDATIRAFQVEPGPRPTTRPMAAIVLIHEIFGLNIHIRDVARRFARQGYVVLAPDLYSRGGVPELDVSNMKALMAFIASIPDRRVVGDLEAAMEYLSGQGLEKFGSIGFCMGGLYSYLLACKSQRLNAAVDFYGRIVYPELTANKPESPLGLALQLKCPLLCHFGEQDASIPVSDVEKLRANLQKSAQPWKINIYPGAGHAFFNDTRPSYNAPAAGDAGTETLAFLKKHLALDAA